MREERTLCDLCGKPGARMFSIFKERKPDGAGSMENWNYTFDLCFVCSGKLLDEFFSCKGIRESLLSMLKNGLDIKWRVE